ncbi:MAG: YqgE/AlgH family protein [Alphaproteobacteria bacterium]|nr:YqgE/AlgH family protein [Alphaproteobacteria bacterium]
MPSARRNSTLHSLPAAAILAALLLAPAAEPTETPSLTGQLLIAAPTIGDPRFSHTVILMVKHDSEGALGIVINRPVGEEPIASLLEGTGEDVSGIEGKLRVFYGGPVQPDLGFVVHSAEYKRDETISIDGRVAMTASRQILRDIGHHRGPQKTLFALGYAGWGPGQLEGEMGRHDWFTTPEEPKLIFDDNRDSLWDDAMARRTREL